MKLALDKEDPTVVVDLRHLNTGKKPNMIYFGVSAKKILQEGIGAAVDDRRHQTVTHMAVAVSATDLLEQVKR